MRVAPLATLALVAAPACKIDLDHAAPDAMVMGRACKVSMSAPSCLAAEAENHSDFTWLQQNMFSTNCSGKSCHGLPEGGATKPEGEIVLATGKAYKTLLGKEATDAGPAPGVASRLSPQNKLVDPGNPTNSYMLFMLRHFKPSDGTPEFSEPPADIGFMPQSNNTLCCQKLDAVERWIAAGALP